VGGNAKSPSTGTRRRGLRINRQSGQPSWSTNIVTLRNNLSYITKRFFGASCSAFANAAGLHHSSVADILRGTAKPGFSTLLQMSIAAGIPAVRLLERPLDLDPMRSKNSAGSTFPRKSCHNYDWPRLAGALAQLDKIEGNAVSLNSFCRGQGCDPGYVAKRLSGSARPIIAKFRKLTAGRHRARLAQEEAELRSAVNASLRGGQSPSFRQIRRKLGKPGVLRNPRLIMIRKQMLGMTTSIQSAQFGNGSLAGSRQ